jgi:histone acetyltransferase (RNA polymerase elongator complex component)
MGRKRLAFFIPGLGCGRKCVYCDQDAITRDAGSVTPDDVRRALAESSGPVELCFFGGSFARVGTPLMTEFLETIRTAGSGSAVTFSSYPGDFDGEHGLEAIRILKRYPIATIELGIPSLDPKVLRACRRDDDPAMILRVAERLRDEGFHVGVQLMMGLPRQTEESVLRDIASLASLMPGAGGWDFRLYPCLVLKGTELEGMYRRGEYKPQELDEAARSAGAALLEAERRRFNIIRVGLHESESLRKSVTAGPYHPAFGEIAMSEKSAMALFGETPEGPWKISRRAVSQLTGHNGRGIRRIAELAGITHEEARANLVIID